MCNTNPALDSNNNYASDCDGFNTWLETYDGQQRICGPRNLSQGAQSMPFDRESLKENAYFSTNHLYNYSKTVIHLRWGKYRWLKILILSRFLFTDIQLALAGMIHVDTNFCRWEWEHYRRVWWAWGPLNRALGTIHVGAGRGHATQRKLILKI